ncbi:MAG: hypothetical protein Q9192_007837, partial [Flavoplaca navasiana]
CLQRPTDAQEQAYKDSREQDETSDKRVHGHTDLPAVDDTQQKESDADFSEHQGYERLDPVSPAESSKKTSL